MDFIEKISMLDELLTMPLKNLKDTALTVFKGEERVSINEFESIMFISIVVSCIDIFETIIKSHIWSLKKSIHNETEYKKIKELIRNMANSLPEKIIDVTDALVDTYQTGKDIIGISAANKAKALSPKHGDLFDEMIMKLKNFNTDV